MVWEGDRFSGGQIPDRLVRSEIARVGAHLLHRNWLATHGMVKEKAFAKLSLKCLS
jgi:hypothetical protein